MKIRSLLMLVALVLVIAFAALNWSAFMAPTTLSLGLSDVQAPLGLVMLGLVVLLTALFLVFVVYLQTSVLFDARHHARELRTNRELADQAEASRFTELRTELERGFAQQIRESAERDAATRTALLTRIDQLDRGLRAVLEQSESSLNAYVGELEDRLEKSVAGQTNQSPGQMP
jgi:hypothetical protein